MTDFAPRTFEEMIAAGRYDLVRPGVNPTAFPLDPSRFDAHGLQIVGFTEAMEIGAVLTRIRESNWQPALPEQLLAYLAEHREAHKQYAIVALGAAGRDARQPPCLLRVRDVSGKRVLETRPDTGQFETFERALIVHPH